MGPGTTRDLVMTLRAAREDLDLSINEIMSLLKKNSEENGAPLPSATSVRSVLNGDLEKIGGFSLETLSPLRDVLIHKTVGDPETRINALLDVIRMQEETIQRLSEQLTSVEQTQQIRCKKCERDTAKLWEQIAIKDRRMERKDRWLSQALKLQPESEEEDL